LGICAAALAPTVLGAVTDRPFAGFAVGFAIVAAAALWVMRQEWSDEPTQSPSGFAPVLRDPLARRLLLIALVNAAPAAVSSTLFLFFVESRLSAPGMEGPLLLLFFLSAAFAAPVWGAVADRIGAKKALLVGMGLAIGSFSGAVFLGPGDTAAFAVICIASGAALGADMTLLPAIFARRLAEVAPTAAEGFGLWSFVSKFTLAFAAVLVLPVLEQAGFQAGQNNTEQALWVLALLYAAVPSALKILAIGLLVATDMRET
jgi:GPH family glycoside/pentoside/hexuronide:cation symporter